MDDVRIRFCCQFCVKHTTNLTLFIYLFILQAAGSDSRKTGCPVAQYTIMQSTIQVLFLTLLIFLNALWRGVCMTSQWDLKAEIHIANIGLELRRLQTWWGPKLCYFVSSFFFYSLSNFHWLFLPYFSETSRIASFTTHKPRCVHCLAR